MVIMDKKESLSPMSSDTDNLSAVDGRSNDKFSVLYVEDNPANLRLVERIIENMPNLTLQAAVTPEQGIELALENPPDLFVLDINLPEMNGYELLKEFQNHSETCNIPAIAISANAMENDIQNGLNAGFKYYVSKPIDIGEFQSLLEKVLAENCQ